jgi:hypothetical protein
MYSASWSIRAVALLCVLSISGGGAWAQLARFVRTDAEPGPLAGLRPGLAPCTRISESEAAVARTAASPTDNAVSPCDTPPVTAPTVNPCNSSNVSSTGCVPSRDLVQEDLATMGKPGQKILRAREKVLEILESENACTAWFRGRDANPAATFRTVRYALDGKGQEYVLQIPDRESREMLHVPYVAKVLQAEGAHSKVTINSNGGFFFPTAAVVKGRGEGGRLDFLSTRALRVGPYWGDTPNAQVLALLHEFGHVIDLLPSDGEDQEGKSAQNTNEVLRYCRAEVESSARRGTLAARR